MTEPTPDVPPPPELNRDERHRDAVPDAEVMPRWVPVMIGIVLIALGVLAVATGFRLPQNPFADRGSQKPLTRGTAPAPPGEPDAGGSLVVSGGSVPEARTPVSGSSRAVVSGGPGGVAATVRIWARRGIIVKATPEDALIYVNDLAIGHASQFDSEDEVYDFPEPGSYTVRVTAPGRRERVYVVTAAANAQQNVAVIEAVLDAL
ncbi:MAG TPA: hypothetical protein VF698_19990 [Thermoanaerobaculia bacterium]|jgi:hypothetical protein